MPVLWHEAPMSTNIDTIKSDFEFLDDWEDRYRYIIELGREMPPLNDTDKNAANKVDGCASQVWLVSEKQNSQPVTLSFHGDSDAHIVRGLVAIITSAFTGKTPQDIIALNADELLKSLGLDAHLSQQRSNGLRAMIRRIKSEAAQA
jgi:cysteine desulfuration protein SufE